MMNMNFLRGVFEYEPKTPLALMHGASSSPSGVTVGMIPTNIPQDLNPVRG